MKLGVDISQIVYEGTGSARYHNGLIKAILEYDRENEWHFLFSGLRKQLSTTTKAKILQRGYKLHTLRIPPTFLHYLWNKAHILNTETFTGKLDWFITSDWTQPPSVSKIATVVHDLAFKRYPTVVSPDIIATQSARLQQAEKDATLFLCLSASTQQDLIEYFNIPSNKTQILYPGVEITQVDSDQIKRTVNKFNLNKPFILSVGKIEPRKNLKRLIEAYQMLQTEDIDLVVVGPPGWDEIDVTNHKNIHFTGYVSDSELSSLYCASLFFVFPSLWEGFGYPMVEAMMSGTPVAASNTSSLKEIGDGAALLFDPLEVESIKNALQKMIDDKNLREDLIVKGKEKSKLFTLENYYSNLMTILKY